MNYYYVCPFLNEYRSETNHSPHPNSNPNPLEPPEATRTAHQTVPYWVRGSRLAWFFGVGVGIWYYVSARVRQEMEGPLRWDHPDEAQNRTVNTTVGRLRMLRRPEASKSGKALPLWVWRDDAVTLSWRGPV